MKYSKRITKIDSAIWQQAFVRAKKFSQAIDLSIGFPQENTPDYIKQAGIAAIKRNFTRYTPANGLLELRQAIVAKLKRDNNIKATADNVTVTPGLATGHLSVFMALLDPGDEVILFEPYFSPYKYLIEMLGAKAVLIDTFPTFLPNPTAIKKKLSKRTRLIIINSPNNPTGAVYPEALLRQIAKLAKAANIPVMSDEIFEYYTYGVPHFSIGSIYPNTITLNGFSKSYAMTGWRLGYIAAPSPTIAAINKLQQYTVFSASSIAQVAAITALRKKPADLIMSYRAKRDLVRQTLSEYVEVNGAEGAIFAYVKSPTDSSDIKFVKKAAGQGVLLLPGSAFSRRHNYFRLSYGVSLGSLRRGLKVIERLYK